MHSEIFDELLKEPNSGTQEISLTQHASYCLHQPEFTPESENFGIRISFNSILIRLAMLDILYFYMFQHHHADNFQHSKNIHARNIHV